MKKLIRIMMIAGILVGVGGAVLPATSVGAVNVFEECKPGSPNNDSAVCKAKDADSATNMISIVINTLLFVLGIIAVIMIVVGGIRYTTSNGDPGNIKAAKDTILYSVVGLVVAILSFAIVNFVVGSF